MSENIVFFICCIICSFIVNEALFYIIGQISCKKHYKKDNNCNCLTCRFYETCEYSKFDKGDNK